METFLQVLRLNEALLTEVVVCKVVYCITYSNLKLISNFINLFNFNKSFFFSVQLCFVLKNKFCFLEHFNEVIMGLEFFDREVLLYFLLMPLLLFFISVYLL